MDDLLMLLAAASDAPPELRVIYAAEARCRLRALRDRMVQAEASLASLEAEIERVAREAAGR